MPTPNKWPLILDLPIRAVPKGRPRFSKNRAYTPERTKIFETRLGWEAAVAMGREPLLIGPIEMSIKATFKHSNRLGPHTSRPDADNIAKAVKDSLNSIVYVDDCQVSVLTVSKVYGREDRLFIEIQPI